jgi:GNAT superfamily N-acetyltransferase
MKSEIEIRQAVEADLQSMQELLTQLFAIEQDFHPDAQRQSRGLRLMLEEPKAVLFVAELAGRVVGMATLQILISTAQGGPVGLVEDVVVGESFRGRGIGRLLLEHLEAWAWGRGLSRLQLLADIANRPALAFYGRQGWSDTCLVALRKLPEPVE